jgi:uncharacterized protein
MTSRPHIPFRSLAVITGASSGIGFELARLCAANGFDLILAADEHLDDTAHTCRALGVNVETVVVDLASRSGVDTLVITIGDRAVDALVANAGHGLGQPFLDQDFTEIQHVIDTNITGTLDLIHQVAWKMRERRSGRILITGASAAFMPDAALAVYKGTKAFIDSFSYALRAELEDSGVTVTCRRPGATETAFFERAGLDETATEKSERDDPAEVARDGFDAMMRGDSSIVTGHKFVKTN